MPEAMLEEFFTVAEAEAKTKIRRPTWRKCLGEGRVGYVRFGRAIRIPASEIRRLIAEGTVTSRRAAR